MTVIRWVTASLKRADCCTRWEGDGYTDVVLAADYDALAAELASHVVWKEKYLRDYLGANERIAQLEAALDEIASRTDWDRNDCGKAAASALAPKTDYASISSKSVSAAATPVAQSKSQQKRFDTLKPDHAFVKAANRTDCAFCGRLLRDHGSTPETACDHRWSAPTPPGCTCSRCGVVVPKETKDE